MSIRNKLSLLFTFFMGIILLLLSIYIYYLSENFTNNEFFSRLEERAVIAGRLFTEQKLVSDGVYLKLKKQFARSLPDEGVKIISEKGTVLFSSGVPVQHIPEALQALLKSQTEATVQVKDRSFYATRYRVGNQPAYIITSAVDKYGNSKLLNLRRTLGISFMLGLITIYFTCRYLTKLSFRPISRILKQVNAIKGSNLHLRLEEGTAKDELNELARTFNKLLSRIESTLDSHRTFVSNASHELRTPLAAMIGEMEVTLARPRTTEVYRASLEDVLLQAHEMTSLLNDLLNLVTVQNSEEILTEPVRIDELIWELQEEVKASNPLATILIDWQNIPDETNMLSVRGNSALLKRGFSNIIHNAIKYSNNQPVLISLVIRAQKLVVLIKDQGIGISEEEAKKIFQPFFRATNARAMPGHGVGLALCATVFKLHGGKISVSSEPGEGTVFKISLPTLLAPVATSDFA